MVGIWRLEVRCGLQDTTQGQGQNVYTDETDCYILFNPWCKGNYSLVFAVAVYGVLVRKLDLLLQKSFLYFLSVSSHFTLIFDCGTNFFSPDDNVYLEDDDKREEYVINDKGKVYVGPFNRSRGRPWVFGQFDDVALPVAVYILELSRIADSERGNAVRVVRGISAGVSSPCKSVEKDSTQGLKL